MIVRINVNVLGYEPGDEVDLPAEWVHRLGDYVTKVSKKDSIPENVKDAPEDLETK